MADTPPPTPAAPAPPPAERPQNLFRQEAIDAQFGPRGDGEVLRLTPRWARWTFWLIVASFVGFLAWATVGTIDEYASGTAIVRVDGRQDLTVRAAGTVATVEVQPGQRVAAGQVLVRLHGDQAELDRLDHEFELQLIKTLDDPTDEAARQSLTSLRTQRELARARLDERTIRAPAPGVLSDVPVRPGQHLDAGEVVASLVPDDARLYVVAIVPGSFRPRLQVGMPMRLEMAGYASAYREVIIDSIGDQVVGPNEIKRTLGQEVADALQIGGPVVLVTARLPARTFTAQGREYGYFDGMQGRAEIRIGSESVLVTLVPGLKGALE